MAQFGRIGPEASAAKGPAGGRTKCKITPPPATTFDTDVVIVGAGPTGLTLANILGLHGIRTLVTERNAATVGEPRAVSIDNESLRTMQYEVDRLLGALLRLSQAAPAPAPVSRRLELAIA